MRDAGAALRHAREDITDAARHAGDDIAEAARHVGDDIADAARQVSTDAARQLRTNAAAMGASAAAVGADAARQIRANASTIRANAQAVPDDLLPAGRDAIRKSLDRVVPGRKRRARRGQLLGVVGVLACTGLALLGARLLMRQSSLRLRRQQDSGHSPDGTAPEHAGSDSLAETVGMAGTTRPASSTSGLPQPTSIAKPLGTPSRTGLAEGQRRAADAPEEAATEPATFDRDAGIRAASEGMEPPDPIVASLAPSETADGT